MSSRCINIKHSRFSFLSASCNCLHHIRHVYCSRDVFLHRVTCFHLITLSEKAIGMDLISSSLPQLLFVSSCASGLGSFPGMDSFLPRSFGFCSL